MVGSWRLFEESSALIVDSFDRDSVVFDIEHVVWKFEDECVISPCATAFSDVICAVVLQGIDDMTLF